MVVPGCIPKPLNLYMHMYYTDGSVYIVYTLEIHSTADVIKIQCTCV
jgi:hypothetical protein